MANGYDQNWDINSYNRVYGNNNLDTRFQGESDIYQDMDQDMNYRPPGSFLPSGIGSFYNQQAPNTLDRGWQHQLELQKRPAYQAPEKTGILENLKNKLSGFTTPAMSFLKKIGGQRSPEKQAFYDAMGGKSIPSGQFAGGTYGGNEYELYKSPSGVKVGSDIIGWGQGYEKNLDSAFGSGSIEEMEQKKEDWALDRMEKFKGKGHGRGISTRLFNALIKRGVIDQSGDRIGTPTDTVTTDTTRAGWTPDPGRTYTDRDLSRIGREHYTGPGMAFEARPSRTFTTPSGKRGYSGGRAEGGRIGYQEGELVEDESMFEATPTGMVEENIEEVQGEPSREQLEAIAFEIFQLPLEELNEEQLEVVYQAAMEQEPSEEEVQFAAQEGPGEGIASLV